MPANAMPAIDVNVCSGWTEQQTNLYQAYPYRLAKIQVERRKEYLVWDKFVGKQRWVPNMGSTLRVVRTDPSPHIRQFAFPNEICVAPKKDMSDVREIIGDFGIYRHKWESPSINFCPAFRDFLNHTEDHVNDIMEKMERFEDIYIRGNIFYYSPYVWIPNRAAGELLGSPIGLGNQANTAANSKNLAWLQATLPNVGNPGNLSLCTLNTLVTVMQVDLRVPPFKGSSNPTDDKGLADMYALVCSAEAFNQFTFDPWMLANKNCSLDVINSSFKGNLFGRITCKLEDRPIRIAADGTFPVPEVREGNPAAYNVGETVVNPVYAAAPYEVAFMVGAEGYESIQVGPPPKPFSDGKMPDNFDKLFWNGEVFLYKNFLIPCIQDDGSTLWETNDGGEWVRVKGQATYGIIAKQRRNIVPIIFKRKRGC